MFKKWDKLTLLKQKDTAVLISPAQMVKWFKGQKEEQRVWQFDFSK